MNRPASIAIALLLLAAACETPTGGPCRYVSSQTTCQARGEVTVIDDGAESGTVRLEVVYDGEVATEEVILSAPKEQEGELRAYIQANRKVPCEETRIVEGTCVPGRLKLKLPPREGAAP